MHKKCILGISGQTNSGKDTIADHLIQNQGFIRVALADPIKRFCRDVFGFTEKQLWGPSKYRNSPDARYKSSAAWTRAEKQLQAVGQDYCTAWNVPDAFPALVHWFFWLKAKQVEISPRVVLQLMGTEFGREAVGENIWIDILIATAKKLLHEDGTVEQLSYSPVQGVFASAGARIQGVLVSDVRFHNEFLAIRKEGGSVIRVVRPETDEAAAMVGIPAHASEASDFNFDDFDFVVQNDSTIADLQNNVDVFINLFYLTHH